jgi:hypothetical protein
VGDTAVRQRPVGISGATSASRASTSKRPVAAVAMTPAVVLARSRSPTIAANIGSVAMDVATPTNNTNEQLSWPSPMLPNPMVSPFPAE